MSETLYGILRRGASIPPAEEVRAAVAGGLRGASMAALQQALEKTKGVERASETEWTAGPLLVDVLDGFVALRLPGEIPKSQAALAKRCLQAVVGLCGAMYALHEPLSVGEKDVGSLVKQLTGPAETEDDILTAPASYRSPSADSFPRIWERCPRPSWVSVFRLHPPERREFLAWFLANIERWLDELRARVGGAVDLDWSVESTMRLVEWYGAECTAGRIELVHVSPEVDGILRELFRCPVGRLNYVPVEGSEVCLTHLMDVYLGEAICRQRKARWALWNDPAYADFGCPALVKDPRTRRRGEPYTLFGPSTPVVGDYGGPLPRIQTDWIKECLAEVWAKFPARK